MLSEKVCYRTTRPRIFGRVVFRSRTDAPTIVTTVRDHERFCGHAEKGIFGNIVLLPCSLLMALWQCSSFGDLTEMTDADDQLLTLTADIVRAHVANNSVSVNDVPLLIATVYGALAGLGDTQGHASAVPAATQKPAVTVRASIKPDRLICLEDGLSMTMLKRHLNTHHQLTPAQYRAKWICRATIRWSRPITAR